MYNRPRGRRGGQSGASLSVRGRSVDAHEGTAEDYVRRHADESQRVAQPGVRARSRRDYARRLLRRVASPNTLHCACRYLALHGGRAAGPDGEVLDRDTIRGWTGQLGPCSPSEYLELVTRNIQRMTRAYGFEEVIVDSALTSSWERAHDA